MKKQYLNMLGGFVLGLIFPLIIAIIIIDTRQELQIENMWQYSILSFVPFIQLGAIGNLALFFLFNWINKPYMQRGIIGATILFGLFIIGLKLFY